MILTCFYVGSSPLFSFLMYLDMHVSYRCMCFHFVITLAISSLLGQYNGTVWTVWFCGQYDLVDSMGSMVLWIVYIFANMVAGKIYSEDLI